MRVGEDAARHGAWASLTLVSTKIALLTELGAVRKRSIADCPEIFRGCARRRRASSSTPAGSCGHGTSARGLAPTAIHTRPRWGRTAAVAGAVIGVPQNGPIAACPEI